MHNGQSIRAVVFIVLVCSSLFASAILGQEAALPRILTLEESIKIGLESSIDMQRYKEFLTRDQEYVKAMRANLKSNANLKFNVPSFDQSVDGIQDIYGVTHYAYTTNTKWTSLLNINQPLPTNGNISINYNFFYHIQKSQLNNYSNYMFLKFEQPIFTPNTLSMGIRRAEIEYERTEVEYTNRRLSLIFSITTEYWDVFEATIHAAVYQQAVNRLRQAYQISQSLFSDGKLEETDVLQLEIELSKVRDEVLSSQSQRDRNLNYFKQIIGLSPEENVTIDTTIQYDPFKLNEERIIQEGLKRSTDIKLNEMSKEEYELLKVDADRASEFKGSIVATYGLDKKDPIFDQSFRGFDKTQSLVMEFYVPLWDWGKNAAQVAAAEARIRSTEISLDQTKKNVVRWLKDRVNELRNTVRRLEILTRSRGIAQRNFELSLIQFRENRIKSQEMILTQNQLMETDLGFIDAYLNYQNTLSDLLRRVQGYSP